jgi:transcriptional regulator with XRE-family HTH domain
MQQAIGIQIAQQISRVRKRKGMSLTALAQAAGIHKSLLSQIESGKQLPSLQTLFDLLTALDLDISAFFQGITSPPHGEPVWIIRQSVYLDSVPTERKGPIIFPIFARNFSDGTISFNLMECPPSSKTPGLKKKAGWHYIQVLEGALTAQLGHQLYTLATGDVAFYDGRVGATFSNIETQTARLLQVHILEANELS